MIIGLGNDIIEVSRIKKILDKHDQHFLNRTFTQNERNYCNEYSKCERNYAGRYAAKEAIVKALGVGFGEAIGFLDIEITNDAKGKPEVKLTPECEFLLQGGQLLVSISHCHEYATAFAILSVNR